MRRRRTSIFAGFTRKIRRILYRKHVKMQARRPTEAKKWGTARSSILGKIKRIWTRPTEAKKWGTTRSSIILRKIKRIKPMAWAIMCSVLALVIAIPIIIAVSHTPNSDLQQDRVAMASEKLTITEVTPTSALTASPDPTQTPTPTPTPTPEPHPSNMVIKEGITAPVVAEIQARLMDLGYMDSDEPTEYYGSITKISVELFQRQHKLGIDGSVGMETYTLLMSDKATKYSVSTGAQGIDVKELQIRLRELGYMKSATGFFGPETEAAVTKFQERNNLAVDGTVGEKTREMLYSEDAKADYFERGQVSDILKTYQERLKKLGYLTTDPDGKYGDDTLAAVKRFQERNGIIADGYLGPQSISLLTSSQAQANALMLGMKGDDVTNIQKRLKDLNYMKNVTGYFGSETENAVKAFQKRNGLGADGKIGKATMSALTSSGAKKAKTGSSSSGSSSGSSGNSSSGSSSGSNGSGGTGVDAFISIAKTKLGSNYVRGAKGPSSFDCSGFVYWCLNQAGVSQGYMTSDSWQGTQKYQRISSMGDLKKGDVISFKGHVGIYLGGGSMINASSSHGEVSIAKSIQSSSYWQRNFVSGFRIF